MSPDLFQRLKEGDEKAFAIVFQEQHRKLYFYARNLIHEDAAAEDVVSDCFEKLMKHLGGFDTMGHLHGWLFVTVRNSSISYLRERRKWKFAGAEALLHLAENDDYHDRMKTEAIVLEVINRRMEELTGRQQEILRLRYREGKDNEEIAVLLNLKPQNVANECSRGLAKLREKLTPEMVALFLPIYFLLYVDTHAISTPFSKNENISRKIMV